MEQETRVVIIGGGATGVGILRDLALRGVPAVLLEQGGLAHGTSSRFHGLLHSGARYAVNDPESARECLEENRILRHIAGPCVEDTGGWFVSTGQDAPEFAQTWRAACLRAGIEAHEVCPSRARTLEPGLTPDIRAVYRVPDAAVDGFRLVWHNAADARQRGARFLTRHRVTAVRHAGGRVTGVCALNLRTGAFLHIPCEMVVNASGPWAGLVAGLADLSVRVTPDRGTLLVFNRRFVSRVINRLRPPGDGDIFVPHGTVTIFGTTSSPAAHPGDTTPAGAEVRTLLALGEPLFPGLGAARILRAFAGNRPLYTPPCSGSGRSASRNFVIVDHADQGLEGMASIFGGKLTIYRLMAEKMADLVCARLGVDAACRTAGTPLAPASPGRHASAPQARPALDRLGRDARRLKDVPGADELVCQCEMVSRAELAVVARDPATDGLHDIRCRTRLGMGTCQGTFCSLRALGVLATELRLPGIDPRAGLRDFLRERWRGLRPALWGDQMREAELSRCIHAGTLNLDAPGRPGQDAPVGEKADAVL